MPSEAGICKWVSFVRIKFCHSYALPSDSQMSLTSRDWELFPYLLVIPLWSPNPQVLNYWDVYVDTKQDGLTITLYLEVSISFYSSSSGAHFASILL